jgi:hypothetical protein
MSEQEIEDFILENFELYWEVIEGYASLMFSGKTELGEFIEGFEPNYHSEYLPHLWVYKGGYNVSFDNFKPIKSFLTKYLNINPKSKIEYIFTKIYWKYKKEHDMNMEKPLNEEIYDKNRLYPREKLIKRLSKRETPRNIRSLLNDLPTIDCWDREGKKEICTKIPEVIYVYLSGRY